MHIPAYVILALAGLGVADTVYLAWHHYKVAKEKEHRPLICPLGFNCEAVIESKYNQILWGIKNEYLGLIFYVTVFILTLFYITSGQLSFLSVVYLIAVPSAVISIVLIYIQGVILKNWCTWCVASAILNLAIYIILEDRFSILAVLKDTF